MTDVLTRVLVYLGAPPGQSPQFYRDLKLGLVFVVSALAVVVLAFERRLSLGFWVGLTLSLASMALSTNRIILIAGLFAIAAIRLGIMALLSMNSIAALAAILCAAMALALAWWDSGSSSDGS